MVWQRSFRRAGLATSIAIALHAQGISVHTLTVRQLRTPFELTSIRVRHHLPADVVSSSLF
jgi:hypothetical protein